MTSKQLVSPFEGEPQTRQFADAGGNLAFRITARELTPEGAKRSDGLATLTTLTGLGGSASMTLASGVADPVSLGAAFILPCFIYPVAKNLYRGSSRRRTVMELTVDEFRVRGFWGWKRYSRLLDHKFSLVPHDKKREEMEKQERRARQAQMRGQVIMPSKYYGESYHLSYDYLGQRNDVMTIFGRKEALAILQRLKACDVIMERQARKGKAVDFSSRDEWAEQPGELPETVK